MKKVFMEVYWDRDIGIHFEIGGTTEDGTFVNPWMDKRLKFSRGKPLFNLVDGEIIKTDLINIK